MDAFKTHEQVISDYKAYLQSFININDTRISEYVKGSTLVQDILPEPLIQFNPAFERGVAFEELIGEGIIDANLPRAFGGYRLYRHQTEAIKIGLQDKGFVVTSGTGSGKSLTFLATIFNNIFKQGANKKKGVKAILVYPMNALINSQFEEIKKYADNYGEGFPITFGQYTGQEGGEKREEIKNLEPDILLTNYMMLELIMTRQSENWLRKSIKEHLKYLVFDELHTYRGRQGSDVSILNRRVQALAQNELIFIGTSATMASKGSPDEKKEKVAEVASTIFGKPFSKNQIVNEYLEPCTIGKDVNAFQLSNAVKAGIDIEAGEDDFIENDLANWLEMSVALQPNEGVLERGKPLSAHQIAEKIQKVTSLSTDSIKAVVTNLLKWAERINEKNRVQGTRKSYLPFRFHQFISQTGSISVTLEPRATRHIESKSDPFIKIDGVDKSLYPVLFSRYSGYDFICIELSFTDKKILPANPDPLDGFRNKKRDEISATNPSEEDFKFGYIVLDEGEDFWQNTFSDFVPESWWNRNNTQLQPYFQMVMPRAIYFDSDGNFSFTPVFPMKGYFMPTPLMIDPTALIVYEDSRLKDSTKLSRLGSEGRSTATSIISYAVINSLAKQEEKIADQKLLSFSDNRQDASLQAGHFNDFYNTIRLRSSLYKVINEGDAPIEVHEIADELLKSLKLKETDYARNPSKDADFGDDRNVDAIKYLLLYRVFQDLKRGWRYILPNLEQVGLLKIAYKKLDKLAALPDKFAGVELLDNLSAEKRFEVLKNILDYFRTSFALEHRFFKDVVNIETLIKDRLDSDKPWSLGIEEKLDKAKVMVISSIRPTIKGIYDASIGIRSGLGKYLQRVRRDNGLDRLRKDAYEEWLEKILKVLANTNFIVIENDKRLPDRNLYKLRVDNIIWSKNENARIELNQTRFNFQNELLELQPNSYFKNLYQTDFGKFQKELIAREHTGQVGAQDRIDREEDFRKGKISTLYCSPTMELGIDIANLNIVHMRNVPPNAANYAQRSGRAGRGGQTALVFTYCSTMSPHDVNYFKNASEMVAGSVQPPRIDLVNEELVSSHLNAFLLMQMEISELRTSAADVLDLTNEQNIVVKQPVIERIQFLIDNHKKEYLNEFNKVVLSFLPELKETYWFRDSWVLNRIEEFALRFTNAFKRWILMFQSACLLRNKAQAILDNHTFKSGSDERREAERQERFARKQIAALKNETERFSSNSEFYVFRYLAAEGFLPGYNFTRLPVRAVLGKSYRDDVEVLSRPRGLALSEFGPNNTIYHSGNKFRINRMIVNDLENVKERIIVSGTTSYAFINEENKTANVDPITGAPLKGDDILPLVNVVEFSECEGSPIEKITCIEEERSRSGYEIRSFFNYPQGVENTKRVILKKDGEKLLQLYFSNATQLININIKARRAANDRFRINKTNGVWVRDSQLQNNPQLIANTEEIYLYTKDTADSLYIQPLSNIGSSPEEIISLSYALKRGIEKLFLVEENEIAVRQMGKEDSPNILIYEASEGSLGILSQLIEDPVKMKEWFKASYESIHFDPKTFEETVLGKTLPHASYQDLLSYYNQIHHKILDRYAIKKILEYLINCDVEVVQGADNDRDEQYKYLLEAFDKSSSTEYKLIKFLYDNGYTLPDKAQINLEDYYISVDFVYKSNGGSCFIFCDGSVHDSENQKADDNRKRQVLMDAGYDVIVWHYSEPVEELVQRRKDIFRKVK